MSRYLELKTAAAETPISTTELKDHLRISNTAEDAYLAALVQAVTTWADGPDGHLRRALVSQTWYLRLEEFPCEDEIYLPVPPLASVTAITYYDGSNALQTLATDYYTVLKPYGAAGEIELNYGKSWPVTYPRPDAVCVEFVAGYGAAADVPIPIKQALLLVASDLYANRGDNPMALVMGAGQKSANMAAAEALVSRYLWREFA